MISIVLFYSFLIFLGREVFLPWLERVLVVISIVLFYSFLFFLGRKAHRSLAGCEFFKNVDFLGIYPLNFDLILKGGSVFLEIVFFPLLLLLLHSKLPPQLKEQKLL